MASAAGPQNSGNVNYFFHIIVFLCITFLFGKLDPIAPLTPFGMNTIGVFLGVIYAWVFIDIIWPSMVGLLALMLLDVLPATAPLNKGFGDPTVIMMMFIFVFSATLERYGLAKYISLWFVSRKCVMGKGNDKGDHLHVDVLVEIGMHPCGFPIPDRDVVPAYMFGILRAESGEVGGKVLPETAVKRRFASKQARCRRRKFGIEAEGRPPAS